MYLIVGLGNPEPEYSMIRKSLDDDTEVTNINYNNIKKIVESSNDRKK